MIFDVGRHEMFDMVQCFDKCKGADGGNSPLNEGIF